MSELKSNLLNEVQEAYQVGFEFGFSGKRMSDIPRRFKRALRTKFVEGFDDGCLLKCMKEDGSSIVGKN